MINRAIAYARGFWHRLHGAVSAGADAISNIIKLARGFPTSVELTEFVAGSMVEEMRAAQAQAARWMGGEKVDPEDIPLIPSVNFPHLYGEEPGEFNHGVLIHAPDNPGVDVPIFWSDDELTDVDKAEKEILDYIEENHGDDSVPFFVDLRNAVLAGRKDWIAPMYIFRSETE
jgi:hypothetical protein